MASGAGLHPECLKAFQDLKLGKKYKYIIFTMNKELTEIVVEKTSLEPNFAAFIEALPPAECRWAVYDFEYENLEGGKRNKIIFVSWAPDEAPTKQKMLASSSKEVLRRSLVGIATEVQATDLDEVAHEIVLDKVGRLR